VPQFYSERDSSIFSRNASLKSRRAQYLRAGGGCSSLLVRRNGEYHHGDVLGNKGVIMDGSGNVLSSNEGKGVGLEYDSFDVAMYTSGSAQTPYRPAAGLLDEEGLLYQKSYLLPTRALKLSPDSTLSDCTQFCAPLLKEGLVAYLLCVIGCSLGLENGPSSPKPTPPDGGGSPPTTPIPQPPTNCPRGMIPIVVNCPKGYISTCVPSNFYQTCLPGCDADGSPDLCKTRLSPPPGKQKQ
jgi:hypothetical protein